MSNDTKLLSTIPAFLKSYSQTAEDMNNLVIPLSYSGPNGYGRKVQSNF